MRQGERKEDSEVELGYQMARKDAEKVTKRALIKKSVCGWALLGGGIVYAFQFESPIGFLVAAIGGGVLAVKDAKSFLGK